MLNNLITANPALANPSVQATAASSIATGGLAAGNYYANYSFFDAYGETLVVPATESAVFTCTGTSQLWTLTLPALPTYASGINVYLTDPGLASGQETLFATGVTGLTYALTASIPADMPTQSLPLVNNTGAFMHTERILTICTRPKSELNLERLVEAISNSLSGYPQQRRDVFRELLSWDGIVATWRQALKEVNTLWWANWAPNATPLAGYTPIGFPKGGWDSF